MLTPQRHHASIAVPYLYSSGVATDTRMVMIGSATPQQRKLTAQRDFFGAEPVDFTDADAAGAAWRAMMGRRGGVGYGTLSVGRSLPVRPTQQREMPIEDASQYNTHTTRVPEKKRFVWMDTIVWLLFELGVSL